MQTTLAAESCTGCGACAAICPQKCISMQIDESGFYFPQCEANKCIQCGLCEKICPVLHPQSVSNTNRAFAAYTKNDKLRWESSSGGVFSELALHVIKKGGAVFGAAYDDKYRVVHICVENEENLCKLRGAKYAQSDISDCISQVKEHLCRQQIVLFAGTPCQVAGLKAVLRKHYPNLITVDFVCHGVPSALVWQKYVLYRACQDNNGKVPDHINLRSKITGWSRYHYSNVYDYGDNRKYSVINSSDLYMKLFIGDYINRLSCTDCHFKGYGRVSDITLGDFWGIWDLIPEMDDNKGTSLIVIHSASGQQIMNNIADKLQLCEVTLEQASAQNPSLLKSSPASEDRTYILRACVEGNFNEILNVLSRKPKRRKKFLKKIYRKTLNFIKELCE